MPLFHPYYHYAFDLLSYGLSTLLFRAQLHKAASVSPALEQRGYWISVSLGAIAGAYFFGSLNLSWSGSLQVGHSIAGAIAGGILAVEAFKWRKGIRHSTGSIFVLSLAAGIALGRLGCFFSGLADQTYGIPSSLPWAINFGDGLPRHPVQLYESLSMLGFTLGAAVAQKKWPELYSALAFYGFILFYAAQRFCWEFLKPYPSVFGPLNTFHILCLALSLYALLMIGRGYADAQPRTGN